MASDDLEIAVEAVVIEATLKGDQKTAKVAQELYADLQQRKRESIPQPKPVRRTTG